MSKIPSETLTTIKNWLEELPVSERTESQHDCIEAIFNAVKHVGYGYPFDRQQREINDALLASLAGEFACKTVWQYYHEAKFIEAGKNERRRYPRHKLVA